MKSKTNRPMTEPERLVLLKEVIEERFGQWEANQVSEINTNQDAAR